MSVLSFDSRLTVRGKLTLLVLVAGLGLFLLGIGGALSLSRQNDVAIAAMDTQKTVLRAVVQIETANVLFKTQAQEFKNILLRGYSPEEYDKYLRQFDDAGLRLRAELERGAGELTSLQISTDELQSLLQELDSLNRELHAALAVFNMRDPLSGQKVDKLVPGRFRKPTTAMNDLVAKVEGHAGRMAEEATTRLMANYQSERNLFLISFLCVVALLVLFATRIVSGLLRELGGEPAYAARVSRRIAAGDLNSRIETRPGDDSSLLAAMRVMQAQLAAIVGDIRGLVERAALGDFSGRIDTRDLHGFGLEIGTALNTLVQTTEEGLNDISHVAEALSAGDLSLTVEHRYQGRFGRTVAAINTTVEVLSEVIAEIRRVVDGAAHGDFSRSIDATGRQGYAKTLAELLNELNRTANGALLDISRVAGALGQGDLSRHVERDYPGLFGKTAQGLNLTIDSLRDLVDRIQQAAQAIHMATNEISSGNADLSRRTEEQACSLAQTAASMDELNATVKLNAHNASKASTHARHSADIAVRGGDSVRRVVATMSEIQDSSRKMADIVGMIDGIAFRTNILALNAAVEAARAGEQGRGFAVVAAEVRALSQRSAKAAKEIRALIDDSLEKVTAGGKLVEETGSTMQEVVDSFENVVTLVTEIAGASREQATGIEMVSKAVTQMDEVTQRNSALVEQAAAAAEGLESQAESLVRMVAGFHLGEGEPAREWAAR